MFSGICGRISDFRGFVGWGDFDQTRAGGILQATLCFTVKFSQKKDKNGEGRGYTLPHKTNPNGAKSQALA